MSAVEPIPPTPRMPSRSPYSACTLVTEPACAAQVAHHGAQNQSSAGRPASAAASNGAPSSVRPVNDSTPGAAAGASAPAFAVQPDSSRSRPASAAAAARLTGSPR
jgi:hypothetical protein